MASAWTPAQLEALSAKQGNFLISAGAGSGKTSVLTQRIYELVASK
jgi:ATP-dependent helicase/nuclease subunit A